MASNWAHVPAQVSMFNSRSQTRNEQFLTNNYWYFWLVWDIFIDVRFSSLLVPIGWSCQLTNMFTWVDITNQICFNVTQCSQFQWFHCHKHGAITNWRVYKFSNPGIPFFCLYDIYWYSAIDITWQVGKSLVNKAVDGRCCMFFLRKNRHTNALQVLVL
jgi:hypothetical protein